MGDEATQQQKVQPRADSFGLASNRVRSAGPVMFQTMPVARSMPTSSRGEEMAARAASLALALPEALPCPIREEPAPVMMARTSAKSTFTSPGTYTRMAHAVPLCLLHSITVFPCATLPKRHASLLY